MQQSSYAAPSTPFGIGRIDEESSVVVDDHSGIMGDVERYGVKADFSTLDSVPVVAKKTSFRWGGSQFNKSESSGLNLNGLDDSSTLPGSSDFGMLDNGMSFHTRNLILERRGTYGLELHVAWDVNLFVNVGPKKGGKTKQILHNMVGEAKSGQFMAIMGSSGCGKSSFLDCLSMRNQSFMGNIFVNRKPIDNRYYYLAGFVHQDDLFIPTVTVREHLLFHALLRMDKVVRRDTRLSRVETVLAELNLQHVADSCVGGEKSIIRGISGGERRRLSFATELLSDPPIIFADEATTGLDAAMARGVCKVLRHIADSGKLVICSIHQPASKTFSLFTHVLLMSQGRTIYLGPNDEMVPYFAKRGVHCPPDHNPADFFVQCIAINPEDMEGSEKRVMRRAQEYEESDLSLSNRRWRSQVDDQLLVTKRKVKMRHYQANWLQQFGMSALRNIRNIYRDPMMLAAGLFNAAILGVIMGLAYKGPPNQIVDSNRVKNVAGLFFLNNVCMFLAALYYTINAFSAETQVFMREHLAGANRVGSYYFAKVVTNAPNDFLYPALFSAIIYFFTGLRREPEAFWWNILITILNANAFSSIGYFLGAATGNPDVALSIAPILVMPNIIFCGIMFDLNHARPLFRGLSYLSVLRFSISAMTVTEFEENDHSRIHYEFQTPFDTPAKAIAYVGAKQGEFSNYIAVLLGYMVGLRLLAYFMLDWRCRMALRKK